MRNSRGIQLTDDLVRHRRNYRDLVGVEKYDTVIGNLVNALKVLPDPFKTAVNEAIRADKGGDEVASLQLLSAAYEIAAEIDDIRKRN